MRLHINKSPKYKKESNYNKNKCSKTHQQSTKQQESTITAIARQQDLQQQLLGHSERLELHLYEDDNSGSTKNRDK